VARAAKAPVEWVKVIFEAKCFDTGVVVRCIISHKVANTFANVKVLNDCRDLVSNIDARVLAKLLWKC
jgi:hypothetical protein